MYWKDGLIIQGKLSSKHWDHFVADNGDGQNLSDRGNLSVPHIKVEKKPEASTLYLSIKV